MKTTIRVIIWALAVVHVFQNAKLLASDGATGLKPWKPQVPTEETFVTPRKQLEKALAALPLQQRNELINLINQWEPPNELSFAEENKIVDKILKYQQPAATAWVYRYNDDNSINEHLNRVEDMPSLISVLLCKASPTGMVPGGEAVIGYMGTLDSISQNIADILKTGKGLRYLPRRGLLRRSDVRDWSLVILREALKRPEWTDKQRAMLSGLIKDIPSMASGDEKSPSQIQSNGN